MPTLNVPTLIILLPILIFGAVIGFRRGWKDETWTLAALLATLLVVARPERALLPVLERLINIFLRAGQAALGRDTAGPAFAFPGGTRQWASFFAFVIFAALSYAIGHLIGKGEQGKGLWKLFGGLVGGLNVVIVITFTVTSFLAARAADSAVQLTIPSFQGAAVVLGTPTTNNVMASWPGLVGMLVVIILLVFILTRAGRVFR